MTRCAACGRPPQGELDAGKEVLLPGEPVDQGCYAEFQAEYARLKGLVPTPTDKQASDQALAFARDNHGKREKTAFDDKVTLWLTRNSQGLHALTGAPMVKTVRDVDGKPVLVNGVAQTVPYTGPEMTALKAEYQAKLDARLAALNPAAKSPGEMFKEALGL